jgi:hypothetical protein
MTMQLTMTLMTTDEARSTVARIKSSLEDIRTLLFDLKERQGWKALGYPTWERFITEEFAMSKRRANQLVNAYMVERILSPEREVGTIVPTSVPESHARELAPLVDEPDALREVHAEVQAQANGKPTAADYRAAVQQRVDPFGCEDCGERFSGKVWHCPTCAHHWADPGDDLCKNCLSNGEYTYRPGFIPGPDDEFAGGPEIKAPPADDPMSREKVVLGAMERAEITLEEPESERALYALSRVKFWVRLDPLDVAEAASDPTQDASGYEELADWVSRVASGIRARAAGMRVVR